MSIAKVLPIHQLIKQTQRRKDDYEWEGDFEKALLEGEYLKTLKEDEAKGITWYPNFQLIYFLSRLQRYTFSDGFTWCMHMLKESNDAQDTNAPFDDVTHWLGYLSRKDIDSTERTTERGTWWKIKSNFLSQELGMET